MDNKIYLGDSVYVEFMGFDFKLTTQNGLDFDPSNEIYLEPEHIDSLIEFKKRVFSRQRADDEEGK